MKECKVWKSCNLILEPIVFTNVYKATTISEQKHEIYMNLNLNSFRFRIRSILHVLENLNVVGMLKIGPVFTPYKSSSIIVIVNIFLKMLYTIFPQ